MPLVVSHVVRKEENDWLKMVVQHEVERSHVEVDFVKDFRSLHLKTISPLHDAQPFLTYHSPPFLQHD